MDHLQLYLACLTECWTWKLHSPTTTTELRTQNSEGTVFLNCAFDGIFTNRNDIKRGFYSFLSFIRDNFSKASLRYPPDVKHIKNDVDGALRRLGMVKKRKNIFK